MSLPRSAVRFLLRASRFVTHRLLEIEYRMGDDGVRHRSAVVAATQRHDMLHEPDEVFYAEEYWTLIERRIRSLR